MRIDAQLVAHAAAPALASRPAGAARFSLAPEESREAARANSAAPLATLDAILMLQQEDPGERRRRHAKRGQDLLDELDKLKANLLAGSVPLGRIESLARGLGEGVGVTGDTGLDTTIAAIELRVRVELAKLGRV